MLCTPDRHVGLFSPSAKRAYTSDAGRLMVTSFSAWAICFLSGNFGLDRCTAPGTMGTGRLQRTGSYPDALSAPAAFPPTLYQLLQLFPRRSISSCSFSSNDRTTAGRRQLEGRTGWLTMELVMPRSGSTPST